MSSVEIMDLDFTSPSKLADFNKKQEVFRVTHLEKKIEHFENTTKQLLINSCNVSLQHFKHESRIAAPQDSQEKVPLLIGDESNKEMPYTEEATIRTHYKRLQKFIKLTDFMLKNSKVNLIKNGTSNILKNIRNNNQSARGKLAEQDTIRNNCWLVNQVFHQGIDISYNPSRETVWQMLQEIVTKSVQRLCIKHKYFIHHEEFQIYNIKDDQGLDNDDSAVDDGLNFQLAIQEDKEFYQLQQSLQQDIHQSFDYLTQYTQYLNEFLIIYDENTKVDMDAYQDMEIEEIKANIDKLTEQDERLRQLETKTELGIFLIDSINLKEKIKYCAKQILTRLHQLLPEVLMTKAVDLQKMITEENTRMNFSPSETTFGYVQQYSEFVEFLTVLGKKLPTFENLKTDVEALRLLLVEYNIKMSENVKSKTADTFKLLTSMNKKYEESIAAIDTNTSKCKHKFEKLVPELNNEAKEILNEIRQSEVGNTAAKIEEVMSFLNSLEEAVQEKVTRSKQLNQYETILQLEEHQFEEVEELRKEYHSLHKLWKSRETLEKIQFRWYNSHFQRVDLPLLQKEQETLMKVSGGLLKEQEFNEVCRVLRKSAIQFKEEVEMLTILRDESIKEEEWQEIRGIAIALTGNQHVLHDRNDVMITIKSLVEIGLVNHREQLAEIQLKAIKGAELVKMLVQVETFWKSANLSFISYKDKKDVWILGDQEELIARIDDNLMTLNNIMASRFVEGIRSKVEVQVKMFRHLQVLLDEWILHQRNWIYLEPVLAGGSSLGLAKESKQFQTASIQWVKKMKKAKENSSAKVWAEEYGHQSTYKLFQKNNLIFDQIQKALEDFLENKRKDFGRFFFLSNESLLEILSTVKQPSEIQMHLQKVFDGIEELELEGHKGENANAMISPEKERVELKSCNFRGDAVEEWMRLLESQMIFNLKIQMRESVKMYANDNTERNQWVTSYCSQIVLTVDAVYWCRITEENYLSSDAEDPLEQWYSINVMQLEELGTLIRGELTFAQRRSIVALITQDVHYRDIIEQLIQANVTSVFDFHWQKQLRFYFEDEQAYSQQLNSQLDYGYEYYGATTRLVITALTDKCWMTITGALHIKLGANPQGPAGTGKTESCKDLAKSLGRFCLVFNCSDQVNVKMTAKVFSGLAYTGSWTCLDEFNRIDIEVLSVIAQQVLQIREALLHFNKDQPTFMFFGKQCKLNNQLGIFVTMNPGYAGRTELPDNLKVLFRPVSMMIPNYAMIAEIMLFSEGFTDASELSRKMTKLYTLSSEQLSQQQHYDFGMRAVKSVLVMAGNLKRSFPEEREDILLIKAMCDSNIPKFLNEDLPLFNAIVGDLFQGVTIQDQPNHQLLQSVDAVSQQHKYGSLEQFNKKVLQLHETLNVRFGVMLVGPAFSGKTSVKQILLEAYNRLHSECKQIEDKKEREQALEQWQMVEEKTINPKSINIVELFGEFQELTQTWTDGLASYIMREAVYNQTPCRQFMTFDGPVDSLWIENLNTVLDDSMTLCLGNGERIKLKQSMKIMFEVADLRSASPATVSRCGMVYISQDLVEPTDYLYKQVHNKFTHLLSSSQIQFLLQQLQLYFRKSEDFIKKKRSGEEWYCMNWLLQSTIDYVGVFLNHPFAHKMLKGEVEVEVTKVEKMLNMASVLAFIWAFGANLNDSTYFERKLVPEIFALNDLPKGNIFGSYIAYTKTDCSFQQFDNDIPEFQMTSGQSFFSMIVPTKEIIGYMHILTNAIRTYSQFYLTGIQGSGKTIVLQSMMKVIDENQEAQYIDMKFSAQTSSQTIQIMIENKLQLQRKNKKQILLPQPGKKLLIVVDDVNMPLAEESGAQPPIELLRQMIDSGGIYDRKGLNFKEVQETVVFIGGGLPGGGRKAPTSRFISKFNQINLKENDEDSLIRIFGSILQQHFKLQNMRPEVQDIGKSELTVQACLNIFQETKDTLKPTPKKPQYLFSLKDVAKVFQGLLMSSKENCNNKESFIKLWMHETMRTFGDRLVEQEEKEFFLNLLNKNLISSFSFDQKVEDLLEASEEEPNRILIFADYFRESRLYEECNDLRKAQKSIEVFMSETNTSLVLFRQAIEHISRICRMLKLERGHGLLIGLGGSGKQSVAKLAGYISDCKVMGVEGRKNYGAKEFREDLYKVMAEAAFQDKKVMFLFGDQNAIKESFYEDINNLIGSGEVPACINKDEAEQINNDLGELAGKQQTDPMSLFSERVRKNVHVVLTMSPIGEGLRNRLNMFPAIASQCAINWVAEWPQDALLKVAQLFLSDDQESDSANNREPLQLTSQDISKISTFSVFVHSNILTQTQRFYQQLKRQVYVTPKTYLNYIEAFGKLLLEKRGLISNQKDKLGGGLTKLANANEVIKDLEEKIKVLQPELEKKSEEMEKLLVKLEGDRVEANKVKDVVEKEERVVNIKAQRISDAKMEADAILSKAMPKIKEAQQALNTLNRADISEIKGNNNPNHLVELTLQCVNILLGENTKWEDIKKTLSDANFLSRLQKYDIHNIPLNIEKKIKKVLADNPDFTVDNVKTVNIACMSMCKWIQGVTNFTDISREVKSKKAVVKQMDEELSAANQILTEKQTQLQAVVDKVNLLEKQFQENKKQLEILQEEQDLCSQRLERASQLTANLAEEQIRWKESLSVIEQDMQVILGNISIAAAAVGYLGPFTGLFRDKIIAEWKTQIEQLELNKSEVFDLQVVLGDTFEIRSWNNMGLPSDSISVVNGLLVKYSSQYPLLIDPQLQGSRWLKNKEKKAGLQVVSMNNENMLKTVEMCIRMGQPVMIEDVKEQLDASLETLLLKDYIVQGSRKMVKIGDQTIDLDPNFNMFFTSKLSNPHFLPEVFIRVTIINFTVTAEGLQEQFLADVVLREMPEVETTRLELVLSIAKDKLQLQKNEDNILSELANSKGNILDNVDLLTSLQNSKETSELLKVKLKETEEKQVEIDLARSSYQAVALRGTILYFVVADLANIDSMYQFSLNYFNKLFNGVIENCIFQGTREERVQELISQITQTIFQNICRGLMNVHKQIFGFLTATQIEIKETMSISSTEWSVFLRGMPIKQQSQEEQRQKQQQQLQHQASEGVSPSKRRVSALIQTNEFKISDESIETLKYLNNDNKVWGEVIVSVQQNSKDWCKWIQDDNCYSIPLPKDFETKLSAFQKLLLVKVCKLEKTLQGMDKYVEKKQGKQYVGGQVTSLETVYRELDKVTPLIFILSPGADPMSQLIKLSKEKKIENEKLFLISLGQGQEIVAEKAIESASQTGGWVVLQNCHLSKSFMPGLEKLLEKQNHSDNLENVNEGFRLFLTSNPVDYFPVSILQNGMKLTNEPPKGIKANMSKTYEDFSEDKLQEVRIDKQEPWRKILLSLSLFHAVVQERRKFGPLGWNIIYEFNESDLETSLTICKNLLESQDEIPWEAIRFVTGEINYGGRVTDEQDIRCLNTVLYSYLKAEILKGDYQFTDSPFYHSLDKAQNLQDYKDYIHSLPEYDAPEVFGMHSNANIALHLKDTRAAIATILSIQPKDVQVMAKESPEEMVLKICQQLYQKLPVILKKTVEKPDHQTAPSFNKQEQPEYIDSLQICMQQECHKFNILMTCMQDQLTNLQKAIKGETAMNQVLDQTYYSLLNNQVPTYWKTTGIGYPSLKPLASYFQDFLERVAFFREWLEKDKPKTYWLSAFYFPQGFLTSVLQNHARKYKIPVDILDFQFQFTYAYSENDLSITQIQTEGVNIRGLFMEGCRFNTQKMLIEDSLPGEVTVRSPIITFIPQPKKQNKTNHYIMPIYKTSLRQGTLSTTGHSTNFIISVETPISEKPEKWILNGTAFLCQLND